MIKAVIFDLDGTILNTLTTISYFVNQTLQKHQISPITMDECKTFIGNGARKLIERSLGSKGVNDSATVEKVLMEYNSTYDADPFYLTEKYAGIEELLVELKAKGIKLGVISNKPHTTTVSAVDHFYPNLFDVVMGGKEMIPLKPNIKAAEIMLSCLEALADEVIYVGDSGVDMKFGKSFGAAYTLGVLWGFRDRDELTASGADFVFDDAFLMRKFIDSSIEKSCL